MNQALRAYLAKIGKRGGAARSAAKLEACRRNGRKGGRAKWKHRPAPEPIATPEPAQTQEQAIEEKHEDPLSIFFRG